MDDTLYHKELWGAYQQAIDVYCQDHGNGLPIGVICTTGDPYKVCETNWSVSDAKDLIKALNEAIKAAKKAGLD